MTCDVLFAAVMVLAVSQIVLVFVSRRSRLGYRGLIERYQKAIEKERENTVTYKELAASWEAAAGDWKKASERFERVARESVAGLRWGGTP